MNRNLYLKHRKQAGAVWVEFLVAASTILISLFLLVPLLGKYIDIRSDSLQAAKYSAWERTVWHGSVGEHQNAATQKTKSVTEIQNEVHFRVLGDANTFIYSKQSLESLSNVVPNSFHYFMNRTTHQYEEILIESTSSAGTKQYLTLTEKNEALPGSGAMNIIIDGVSVVTEDGLDVERDGYYTESIKLTAKVPDWYSEFSTAFPSSNIEFEASNSILVDGWGAGGTKDNIEKVQGLKPLGANLIFAAVDVINTVYKTAYYPFSRELKDLDFEKVDVEQLLRGENPNNTESRLGVY